MGQNKKSRRVPKASEADLEAVKKSAADAGEDLDREQEESVLALAEALGEISEGEAVAHIDARLAFVERQVERLNARKEEADRGVQGELAVMRARLEDALTAVGATAEEQREAWIELDRKLSHLVADSESRTADSLDALRTSLIQQVEDATDRLEKTEARIRGEAHALDESIEERIRLLVESAAEQRDDIDSRLEETSESLRSTLAVSLEETAAARQDLEAKVVELVERVTTDIADARQSLSSQVDRTIEELRKESREATEELRNEVHQSREETEARFASQQDDLTSQITASLQEMTTEAAALRSGVEEKLGAAEERLNRAEQKMQDALGEHSAVIERISAEAEANIAQLSEALAAKVDDRIVSALDQFAQRLAEVKTDIDQALSSQARELEGRFSEARAEMRIETQGVKSAMGALKQELTEGADALSKELGGRIRSSEEKAASAALHLESMIVTLRRQIASDETEWSELVDGLSQELADLKIRVEDLVGRIAASDARYATARGATQVTTESLNNRLEVVEKRVREGIEEIASKTTTRLEVLAAQVAKLKKADVDGEEANAGYEFVGRRTAEISERVDEVVAKVNALGRYISRRPELLDPKNDPASVAELSQKVDALERMLRSVREKPAPEAAEIPAEVFTRMESVEKAIDVLIKRERSDPAAGLGSRLDRLERAVEHLIGRSNGGSDIDGRLDDLEEAIRGLRKMPSEPDEGLDGRIAALEQLVASMANQLTGQYSQMSRRLQEMENKNMPAPNILPNRKRGIF